MQPDSSRPRRRDLLKTAAGGVLLLKPQTVFGTQANSAVEVGLIGCGGRGNWIGAFFPEFTGARIVALADVIRERLDATQSRFKVDAARAYYGPEADRELIASKLDAVAIETPPYFHPEQARAAVDAGKHVYVAKPVAVDVPGCRSILESGKRAQGKRSFLVDFQTRSQPVFQEAVARLERGDIGKPVFAQVFYYAGRPAPDKSKPGMDPGEGRILNFYMDRVLGGDIIVEQNIHVIDLANWYLRGHPLSAHGTGGRTDWTGTPYNTGDAYDHFLVTYLYPDGVQASFSSNQLTNSYSDLCVRCFGIKGAVDSHYGGLVRITGENSWLGAEKDDTFKQGAINNVKAFIDSIQTGKLLNNAETAVESNLTAILGRNAAYQNSTITWEELLRSEEKFEANLKLRW
ncbi:MAG TPA: Gfo/Idh/MocA family oxidoreductase [Bryobacteraceae bacterium]|nr:Gfo/Idh/MocA family oxidoreductase [Bryobacteraceae bacterium]